MKILLIVDQFDNGNNGTTMTAQRLFDGLKELGHEVRVVSTGERSKDKYVVKEYHLIPVVNHIVSRQGMTFAKPDENVLRRAIGWADLVHFILPFHLASRGLKIAKELGVPHTAAFHLQPENITYTLGMGTSSGVNRKLYQFFYDYFYHEFTHIHCPSRFIANELEKNGYKAKLHVISNGVDPDFVYEKKEKPAIFEGRFVILMVGRYSNEKRQDILLEAAARSRYCDRIQVILAGQGLNQHKYERLGKKLKYPPVLKFYSHEELLDVLAWSDLYVHAADAEIEAISCLEAIARGLVPVIANSSKSATPQFALDERSLFEAGNSEDLAGKIDYWIEQEEERRRMERVYSEHALQYNLMSCVRKMEAMFCEAIQEEKAGNSRICGQERQEKAIEEQG